MTLPLTFSVPSMARLQSRRRRRLLSFERPHLHQPRPVTEGEAARREPRCRQHARRRHLVPFD